MPETRRLALGERQMEEEAVARPKRYRESLGPLVSCVPKRYQESLGRNESCMLKHDQESLGPHASSVQLLTADHG